MKRLLVLFLFVISCGDNEQTLWNKICEEISVGWCGANMECGFISREEADECRKHVYFHCCELEGTCKSEVVVEEKEVAEEQLDQCLLILEGDLREDGWCPLIWFGIAPKPCVDALSHEPETM